MTTPDRINYSFGMKLPGPERYSSIDFHVSLSSDVGDGESLDDAYTRVKDFVEAKAEGEMNEIRDSRE